MPLITPTVSATYLSSLAGSIIPLIIENESTREIISNKNTNDFSMYFVVLIQISVLAIAIFAIYTRRKAQANKKRMTIDPPLPNTLKSDYGFIFGKKNYEIIAKNEHTDGHVLVVGSTRSGKSSCIAIPTLKAWRETAFVIDIKGELYEKTKQVRYNVKKFDPLDTNAFGYDPFQLLKKVDMTRRAQEAQDISQALIPMPNDVKDPFWINSARSLLTGAMLHFFNENLSFIETIEKITSMSATKLINELVGSSANQVINYISAFVKMDEKTLSGIYMELHNHINLYVTDIDIKNSLSAQNCISPEDLENGQDIYVTLPEYRLEAWKNLFGLMISQFLTHFEKRPDRARTPILFLLDEFPRLGKNEKIAHALATLNGKNITMCLIVQNLPQLDSIYGENIRNSMCGNCDYKVVLKATDGVTQKYFSELVGTYERDRISKGKNYAPLNPFSGSSENEVIEEKRLIRPEEFATLPDIVLLTPHKALTEHSGFYRIDRKPYYED